MEDKASRTGKNESKRKKQKKKSRRFIEEARPWGLTSHLKLGCSKTYDK